MMNCQIDYGVGCRLNMTNAYFHGNIQSIQCNKLNDLLCIGLCLYKCWMLEITIFIFSGYIKSVCRISFLSRIDFITTKFFKRVIVIYIVCPKAIFNLFIQTIYMSKEKCMHNYF